MLETVILSVTSIGGIALLIWVVRSIKRWGASQYAEKIAKQQRDAALEENKDLANRPRTLGDRLERLRAWRNKLKN